MRDFENFIGGSYVSSRTQDRLALVDPSTGDEYATSPLSSVGDLDAAFTVAERAFSGWRRSTPADRQEALLMLADALEANAAELADIESLNTGKPVPLVLSEEFPPMLDQIRFFAGAARVLEGLAAAEYLKDHTSWIRREPVGVIGQVAPWNYPLMMAVWKVVPAIAAGNTVVLKPSDTTPASALKLAEIASSVLPDGVLNVVCGDRATGHALVSHPTPDMVSITGSVEAGMAVAKAAASDVKRVHLELGGKAPVLVFSDADVDAAAATISEAGMFNAGQDCTSATRVIVHDSVHDEFVTALTRAVSSLDTTYEGGRHSDAFVPPLNNKSQFARVTAFLARVPGHATVTTGGGRHGDRGYYVDPTVVAGLHQDDEMIQKEVFGPVISVQSFSRDSEALAMANGVQYALASSVWTRDFERAMRFSAELDFGCVWINTHIPLVAEMPHGGFKHSGYGKDLSMYGLEDYTRIKHVMAKVSLGQDAGLANEA